MLRLTITVLLLSATLFADSFATTWLIKPDGTGDAPTIQAGIDSAVAGDTVSLKNGTYRGDGNRDIDFLGKAIVVRSELGQPSWCVIDCEGSETEYHRGFHLHSGEDSTSVLEGLTIKNGYLGENDRGAGILCENSSAVTLLKCWINGNTIYHEGKGAGLYCDGVSMRIDNCEFQGNRTQVRDYTAGAHYGGGIYADACTLSIRDSHFSNRSGRGGGVYCRHSRCSVTGTTFLGNTALDWKSTGDHPSGYGGGVCAFSSDVSLIRCFFVDNYCGDDGGGVYAGGTPDTISVTQCVFSGNKADRGTAASGGGILCGDGTFTDCIFRGNIAYYGYGGGVNCGDSSVFTRCTFERNRAYGIGGGVIGGRIFDDCQFIENYANGGGGGVWSHPHAAAEFTNCLFVANMEDGVAAGNSAFVNCTFTENGGRIYGPFSTDYGPVYAENTTIAFNSAFDTLYFSPVTLVCCDVYGNEGGDWVGPLAGQEGINGNFSAHPMFCDPDNGDFTLASISPCLPPNNECDVLIGAYGQGCDYAVGIPDDRGVPPFRAVITAYPNPFNPSTTIEYYVPGSGTVSIRLYDVSGRLVTTLIDRHEEQGLHTVTWDGTDLRGQPAPSGIYFVRLESGVQVQTRKIVLLK